MPGVIAMSVENRHQRRESPGPAVAAGRWGSSRADSALIFLVGMIVFLCCPAPEFIGFNPRFAVFAQEMLRNGPTFFPTTYGSPYPDYPASSTFLIYLASLPFGRVTPLTGILPTAVVSSLILVVIYRIGEIRSRTKGLVAVLFALFTAEFLGAARSISLDQYTSLATASSFYLVYSSDCLGRNRRLWLLPGAWLLGFAFRGPVGLVIPALVTGVYCLWTARFRKAVLVGIATGCLFILCCAGLLLAARRQGGTPLLNDVIAAQFAGRFGDRGAGFGFYWYGALISCAVSYPLALLVVASRWKNIVRRKTEEDRFLGVLTAWVLAVLIVMSIPAAKKTRYITPIIPGGALIAASLVTDAAASGFLSRTKQRFLDICNGLPLLLILAVGGFYAFACLRRPEWCTSGLAGVGLLAPLLVVSWKLDRGWKDLVSRDLYRLAVGVASWIVVSIAVAEPITYSQEKTVPFVRQVEALLEKTPGTVTFFQVGPDAEDVKFVANLKEPLLPRFADSFDAVWSAPGAHYVIMKESAFRSLPQEERKPTRMLVRGRIGHRDFVAFTREEAG